MFQFPTIFGLGGDKENKVKHISAYLILIAPIYNWKSNNYHFTSMLCLFLQTSGINRRVDEYNKHVDRQLVTASALFATSPLLLSATIYAFGSLFSHQIDDIISKYIYMEWSGEIYRAVILIIVLSLGPKSLNFQIPWYQTKSVIITKRRTIMILFLNHANVEHQHLVQELHPTVGTKNAFARK